MKSIVLVFRTLKVRILDREFLAQSGASYMQTQLLGKAPQMDAGAASACRVEVERTMPPKTMRK
ncbi:MAG: hypothetical protein ACPL7O_07630, partial [Armatimonadota bacterium]